MWASCFYWYENIYGYWSHLGMCGSFRRAASFVEHFNILIWQNHRELGGTVLYDQAMLVTSSNVNWALITLRSQNTFQVKQKCLKNMAVLLYTYFYSTFLNVLWLTFFDIYNLPFLRSPNIGKIRVKVGPKTNYFSYILSSRNNRIAVFNYFFSLICSQPRHRQNRARDFLLSKYFFSNLLLTVFIRNTLSKLVELLQ